MAVEIDILNLERAVNALACTIRDTSERAENAVQSLAAIADAFAGEEGIANSLLRIANRLDHLQNKGKSGRKRLLQAVRGGS